MKRNGKLCEIDLFPVVLNEPVPSFLLASVCDMIELEDFQINSHLAKLLEHHSNRLLVNYPQISRFCEFRNRVATTISRPRNFSQNSLIELRVVQTQSILFLKSMLKRVGSDMQRL